MHCRYSFDCSNEPRGSAVRCVVHVGKSFSWQQVKAVVDTDCKTDEDKPPKGVKLHTSHDMERIQSGWRCVKCKSEMHKRDVRRQLQPGLIKRCEHAEREASQNSIGQFFTQASYSSGPGDYASEPGEMAVEFF